MATYNDSDLDSGDIAAALTPPTGLPLLPLSFPSLHTPAILPHDFWFVKTKKVGGSTLKGVLNAICAHYAITCMATAKMENGEPLGYWSADNGPPQIQKYRDLGFEHLAITDHGKFSTVLAQKLKDPLLFTAVRNPVARFVSQFFFVYREEGAPGEPDLLTPTMQAVAAGQPIPEEVLGTMRKFAEQEANLVYKDICDDPDHQSPAECFAPYDFVFVQEKFDESLVAFAIDYGLSLRDIAYTSAKNQTGKYPTEAQLPPEIVDFIKKQNDKDAEVYRMGVDALDLKINGLRDAYIVDPSTHTDFDAMLREFKSLQTAVVKECSDHMQWYEKHGFNDGWFYSNDGGAVGEGFRCIDWVARRFEAGQRD